MANLSNSKRCLWGSSNDEEEDDGVSKRKDSWRGSKETYAGVFSRYSSKPEPKSFFQLVANSLVVVQELSLTCFFLARHRRAHMEEDVSKKGINRMIQQQTQLLDISNYVMLAALLTAVFYSSRAGPSRQQSRRSKVRQRGVDALLLAIFLRLLASLLKSLTASFSSDTVQLLAFGGMLLHLVACDYSYANGIVDSSMSLSFRTSTSGNEQQQQQRRPPFLGGTVALNAALFSSTLLVSRLSSNVTAYLFSCLSVILFAFYHVTRHAIAASYPPTQSVAVWIITFLVLVATILLLLDDFLLVLIFGGVAVSLGVVLPAWKCWFLQSSKALLRGPWDIPHAASMQLDFRLSSPSFESTTR